MKYLVIFSIIFFSCNTEKAALRKYARLKAQHPKLFKTDSVTVRDTIYIRIEKNILVPEKDITTQVPDSNAIIADSNFILEFWIDSLNRLMLNARTKPDTIRIIDTIPVLYEKTVPCPERPVELPLDLWPVAVIVVAICAVIVAFFKK